MGITEMIGVGLTLAGWLQSNIPKWIERAKKSGELTAEQEAEFKKRQAAVFSQPYAQPEKDSR